MNDLLPKSYPYKPKLTAIAIAILLFGAVAAVVGHQAISNDRGLILNGIFVFSERGATIFYWVLTGCSVAFVGCGFALIAQRLAGSLNLDITEDQVYLPKGFINKSQVCIPIRDIIKISEKEVQGQRFLYLHTQDKKHCINRSLLPDKETYEEVRERVAAMHNATRNPGSEGAAGGAPSNRASS